MLPSKRAVRQRKLLLAVVGVASGVTISCSEPGAIGVYNPGWDAAFEDAAKKEAGNPFGDAATDASEDATADANDDAETADAASD